MKKKTGEFAIFLLIAFISYLFLVILLFLLESGQTNSNIKTFADAVWYSLVTLTTVGYGDFYPVTLAGKLVGILFVLGSLGTLGLFIGKVGEKINDLRERKKMGLQGADFRDHVIILGWDTFAHSVAIQLINSENRIAVVTDKKEDIDFIYEEFSKEEVFVLFADLNNPVILEKANVEKAYGIFVNLRNDVDKLVSSINLKKEYPEANLLVTLDNLGLKDTFYNAGVNHILSKNEIASKLIASYIFEPDVAQYASDLISAAGSDSHEYDIQQFKIMKANPYLGKNYGDAFKDLKREYNAVLIGIVKNTERTRQVIKLPDDYIKIELNDFLIMILNGKVAETVADIFGIKEGVFRQSLRSTK